MHVRRNSTKVSTVEYCSTVGTNNIMECLSHSLVNEACSLPTAKLSPQVSKLFLINWFCQDISKLLSSVNRIEHNCFVEDKLSKVMVLQGNVLSPWSKFGAFSNSDATSVILPCSAFHSGWVVIDG